MKFFKSEAYLTGAILLAAGIVIAFIPKFISTLFYIAGAAMIIYNIILLILSCTKGTAPIFAAKSISGILIGFLVCAFPTLLSFGLPVVFGIVFSLTGAERIISALQLKKTGRPWLFMAVLGVIALCFGAFLFFNPFSASALFKRILGIILIAGGIAVIVSELRAKEAPPSVIDIDDFSVKDDEAKRLK